MTSNRPYLVRALYEWLVDNGLTPYLLVDAMYEGVQVPQNYVEDGRIVLNIGPGAVRDLSMANDLVSFSARFGGNPENIFLPPQAVLGIYARENGKGMLFPEEQEEPQAPEPSPSGGGSRPALKVVK